MAKRKKSDAENKVTTVFAKDPSLEEGKLKRIGGSASDDWNGTLANQQGATICHFLLCSAFAGQQLGETIGAIY
jgi:hypothetical protein